MTTRTWLPRNKGRVAKTPEEPTLAPRPLLDSQDHTLINIEGEVLRLVSDPSFLKQGFVSREQQIFQSLNLLEEYISKKIPSFLCGDFLVFDRRKARLTSIAKYPIEGPPEADYPRPDPSFHHKDAKPHIKETQRAKHADMFEKGLLFSRFVRQSPAEKKVLIVLIQSQKGNDLALKLFEDKLDADLKEHGFESSPWIKRSEIVDPSPFMHTQLLRALSGVQARAKAEFDKINAVAQLAESNVRELSDEGNAKYRILGEYFDGLKSYADKSDLKDGYVMVYCPAIFAADEPPANFWGMFSAKVLAESPGEAEQFLHNIIYIETCLSTAVSQVVGMLADKSARELLSHARRAAVAAIMSRNMSHNIGSHVSPRATLDRIAKRLDDFTETLELDDKTKHQIEASLKTKLDEYIQKKADFLAEITTEPLATTKSAFFYREVISPFIQNSLLMDNLAANEDVNFPAPDGLRNRLIIRVFSNGKEITSVFSCQREINPHRYHYPIELPYSMRCPCNRELVLEGCGEPQDCDLEIELPGPLGEYAMFGLLENYIRNVAKHNRDAFALKGFLEVRIDLSEPDTPADKLEFHSFRITDNLSLNSNLPPSKNRSPWTLRDQIEEYLKSDIIEIDGLLKREAWGLAEMKICASLLRGSSDFSGMTDSLQVDLDDGRIALKGKLMKSKKVCVVVQNAKLERSSELMEEGIWVFNQLRQLEHHFSQGGPSISPASFRFVFLDFGNERLGLNDLKTLKELMQELPFRILVRAKRSATASKIRRALGSGKVVFVEKSLELSKPADQIYQACWELWVKGRFEESNGVDTQLHVYLEQFEDEQPTGKWLQSARAFNSNKGPLRLAVWCKGTGTEMTINDHARHLIYDRHGGILKFGMTRSRPQIVPLEKFPDDHYYNVIDKGSSDFTLLFSPAFPVAPATAWSTPWEIAEAALLRVVVVDERIAERAFDVISADALREKLEPRFRANLPKKKGLHRFHLAWASRVFLATDRVVATERRKETVPLHLSLKSVEMRPRVVIELNPTAVAVNYYETSAAKPERIRADMIVIHLGVLDLIVEDILKERHQDQTDDSVDLDKRKKNVLGQIVTSLETEFPFVVIDSGRGIPHSLPGDQKFLPFSIVQDYLLGQRVAKYCLTRVAMSLRRRRAKNSGE